METRWRLGYYNFTMDESRHNLSYHLLAQMPWDPVNISAQLSAGTSWILTGEDLGIDPIAWQSITPYDHLSELAAALTNATGIYTVAGQPDQVVYTFANGGRLLLDRRSFDYWSSDYGTDTAAGWDDYMAKRRTQIGDYSGTAQQFQDAYSTWWLLLNEEGLFGSTPLAAALLPVPSYYDLATWWQNGFADADCQAIRDAFAPLGLPDGRWVPPTVLNGFTIGTLLFDDDFDTQLPGWITVGGNDWYWQDSRLYQNVTIRDLNEGDPWGGDACYGNLANPSTTPILIEAEGRITFGATYGKFGVYGGTDPTNPYCTGIGMKLAQGTLEPADSYEQPLQYIANGLSSLTDDIDFLLLIEGKTMYGMIWNPSSQPQPANWMFTATVPSATLVRAYVCRRISAVTGIMCASGPSPMSWRITGHSWSWRTTRKMGH